MNQFRKTIYRSLILEGLLMLKNIPVPIQSLRTGVYRDVANIFALLAEQSIADFNNFDEAAEQLIILQIRDLMVRYHYYNVGKIPEYLEQLE